MYSHQEIEVFTDTDTVPLLMFYPSLVVGKKKLVFANHLFGRYSGIYNDLTIIVFRIHASQEYIRFSKNHPHYMLLQLHKMVHNMHYNYNYLKYCKFHYYTLVLNHPHSFLLMTKCE